MKDDIYRWLANHLSRLGMGYPSTEDLEEILKANFTPKEAEIALALPTDSAETKSFRYLPIGKSIEHKIGNVAMRMMN